MVRLVILRILESYFRHRWLYLLPIILMWGVAGVAVFRAPLYLAHGIMYVEQENVLLPSIPSLDTNSWETRADQTSHEISDLLQTDAFIRSVIQDTDLEKYMTAGNVTAAQTMRDARNYVWADAPGRNQVRVAATHTDPQIAYQLVDATIENYTLWKINANLVESEIAEAYINDLITEHESKLETARHELENYYIAHPAPLSTDGDRPASEILEIDRLQTELAVANARYSDILRSKDNAELASSQAESSVRQTYIPFDAPRVPEEPATTRRDMAVQIVIFTVVGVILSVVAVIGGMLLDRSFRFPIDVQYGVNLPVIATVPDAG